MKKVLLINPKSVNKYYHLSRSAVDQLMSTFLRWSFDKNFWVPMHSRCTTMPPITLYAIKALIETRCEVLLVDEQVAPVAFEYEADLVCITSTTLQIRRACQISGVFLKKHVPTAIGGVHASALPDECQKYFSTVCVGEAEGYIERMLEDLYCDRLAARYTSKKTVSMEDTPFYLYG